MKRLLIIGCGDVALRTIPLLTRRYRVFALVRNLTKCAKLRTMGVTPILGDLDHRASLTHIAGLADVVLHFAPPSAGLGGELARGRTSIDTRTRNLLSTLSQGRLPKQIVYISTSGVYGDCAGAWVSETRPLKAVSARSLLRVDAEKQIRNWATRNQVHASILRVPGIYAADRLPLDRLRIGTPAIVQAQDSYTNHIHADDLARIVIAALHNAKPNRVYHASDDSELKMGDYFDVVADAHHLPRPPRLPRAEVERAVSPALWSFMNESRRMTNARMKRELKVELRYPTIEEGLRFMSLAD